MILTKKIRIKPTKHQEEILWKSVGVARWTYNWAIARQQDHYKKFKKILPDNELRKEITQIKQLSEFYWLGEVSNNVAKQAVKDACDAYKKFFKGNCNLPRFKTKKRNKPSFYNDNVKLKVKKGLVKIEKVGWIKTSEQIPLDVKYRNPRVTFDGAYWYLSIGIDVNVISQTLTDRVIGIDLGIKDLAVCSNGQVFKNINKTKNVKKIEKRLRRLQKKVSHKYLNNKKGNKYIKTQNILKMEKQILLIHRKLTNIRRNYLHQVTSAIVKTKPCKVVMENLNVSGMMKNRYLSKAIAKQGFYEFIRQVKYKCEKNGITFIQVDRFFPSSKTCSNCGTVKKDLKLYERVYKCNCGNEINRDLNAAINLAKYGELTV
jgi:putative transposase